MAPLSDQQLEQKKQERKLQIMQSAIKVFSENGLQLTKMNMIAKEAGVSHGLVYHYFSSKEEVLYESLKWVLNTTDVKSFFQKLNQKEISSIEKIKQFTMLAFTADTGNLSYKGKESTYYVFRLIQVLSTNEQVPQKIKALYEDAGVFHMKELRPIFIEGKKNGEIIDQDTDKLLSLYLGILSGLLADDPEAFSQNVEWNVDILLRMISTR